MRVVRQHRRPTAAWALVATVLLLSSGCARGFDSARFRTDDRVSFVAPRDHATVTSPVTLRWTVEGSHTGEYAIFVDRAPVAPGETLRAVAKGDRLCNPKLGCPDTTYLEQRQVYTTEAPQFTLPQVRTIQTDPSDVQMHTATIVVLDADGRRDGEGAWTVRFKLAKPVI